MKKIIFKGYEVLAHGGGVTRIKATENVLYMVEIEFSGGQIYISELDKEENTYEAITDMPIYLLEAVNTCADLHGNYVFYEAGLKMQEEEA